jgi:F-type H+-transporting ATPase subunit epsilon
MAEQIQLQIITPQQEILKVETPWVVLPGTEGEMGILPQHIGLVTTLATGLLKFGVGAGTSGVAVHYGYAQVADDQVTVLAEMAETAEGLDLARAVSAEQKARSALGKGDHSADPAIQEKNEAKLKRALVRQQLAALGKS